MAFLRKLLRGEQEAGRTEELLVESGIAEETSSDFVEVDVVGESNYQDVLERIAGPKQPYGAQHPVGIALRAEPKNPHDSNAVRVEVFGQVVGYVPRIDAAQLSPILQRHGGAAEGRGLIVGGWRDGTSEGSFGCRAWLTGADAQRLGYQRTDSERLPSWPPPGADEQRLSPVDKRQPTAMVTVTCEEHYQATILATRPAGHRQTWWPVLLEFVIFDGNPHSSRSEPCIGVLLAAGRDVVGYLTPAMTSRHAPRISAALASGRRPTVHGLVEPGEKRGATLLRVKAAVSPQA